MHHAIFLFGCASASAFTAQLPPKALLSLPAASLLRVAAPVVASESVAVTTSKAVLGLASQPVAWSSVYTLATTGCGLRGEIAGTIEGVAYVVVAGFALGSLFTRVTTGLDLRTAELEAVEAEMAVLEAAGASDERLRLSAQKAKKLADGPADLLGAAETLSLFSSVLVLAVFGFEFFTHGSLPSAVPDSGQCWS